MRSHFSKWNNYFLDFAWENSCFPCGCSILFPLQPPRLLCLVILTHSRIYLPKMITKYFQMPRHFPIWSNENIQVASRRGGLWCCTFARLRLRWNLSESVSLRSGSPFPLDLDVCFDFFFVINRLSNTSMALPPFSAPLSGLVHA